MEKNCDNCIHSGRPSYEYPCTACETAYGSAPSKWESMVSATADMVEVVRCKDCKHNEDCIRRIQFWGRNPVLELNTTEYHPIDFCSYGERKLEDEGQNDC